MGWDDQIEQVRKQITELRSSLEQNEKIVDSTKEAMEDARMEVAQLLVQPANPREALYQLPLVLESVANNRMIGTILFGQDGKVIMHNGTVQRALAIDPATRRLPQGVFKDGRTGEKLTDDQLPWARCLRGHETLPSCRLIMTRPGSTDELHLEVSTISLSHEKSVGGVVALFLDLTETVKADHYIKKLCHQLELHMSGIEQARRELKFLTDKLGHSEDPASPPPQAPPAPAGNKLVLVADDIPVNQRLLVMQLKKLGVEHHLANNGLEAVELCKQHRYALIFMDCDMPILNGFEATEQIRQQEAKTGIHTPIAAMTSYDREGDKEKCLQSGMDEYLAKGLNRQRVNQIVDQYVFGKEPAAPVASSVDSQSSGAGLQLDPKALKETLGDETESIITLFFGSTATLLNCLQFAIEDKDTKAVHHFAYSLKGPCSSLGLALMAKFATQLSTAAEQGRWEEAADVHKSLTRMFHVLKSASGNMTSAPFATLKE